MAVYHSKCEYLIVEYRKCGIRRKSSYPFLIALHINNWSGGPILITTENITKITK